MMLKMYSSYGSVVNFDQLPDPSGSWELGPVIGEGTYGQVFQGFNMKTGEEVAIKVMESVHEMIEEIEEEYQVLRDLSEHPNMPRFFGMLLKRNHSYDDQIWLIMEICAGGSVTALSRSLLKTHQHLEEYLIAHILKETVRVLHHLHEHNVMHRDVKGHNILLTHTGIVKLVDFGVSGHLDSPSGHRKTHVGTPYWMAPEVIACEQQLDYSYDVRCDVWSLGITAIELAEGKPPHADVDPRRALFKIPRSPPPKLSKRECWSPEFHDFISQCLIKDFEKRPFTADLLSNPFLQQVPHDTTHIREKLAELTAAMEHEVAAPDITTKHGQLKSGRKSRKDVEANPLVDDLATLEILDEDVIVNQLSDRYADEFVYTYIGDILLAVNPFTPLTIYSEAYTKNYQHAAKADNPPHIYAVADQSYQSMIHNEHDQCIVISGESGAGKTESANFLVQQLTQLGKAENRRLEDRILQVNPLMEAFGNAKTVINDNSSRFGKYLEMFFTLKSGVVIGAKITEYLLEKSRVIYQAPGEQNFHVFYYIHDGLVTHDQEEAFHLKQNTAYRYIHEYTSQPPDAAGLSVNRVKFKAIEHCFNIIGFQEEEVKSVYQVLVAILHTGNIDFVATENSHGGESCDVQNNETLLIVAKLLGLDIRDLQECLTSTGMVAKGEVIVRSNTVQESMDARDAMSKALYGRLFSWIVNRISALLKPTHTSKEDERVAIGLLDIFGFENFKSNSFEQLCINIANEQIQYYFNQHIFAWELAEYEKEEIDAAQVTYVDNRPILDMFLSKPVGLLSLLDEESHFPKATDQTLIDKFNQNIKSSMYSKTKGNVLQFCIDHFAGKIEYDATGFLEKNRDRLPVEIANILKTSDNPVVRSLFQTPLTKTGNLQSGMSSQGSSVSPSPIATMSGMTMSYSSRSTSAMGGSRHMAGSASMTRIQQTVATYFRFSLMDLLSKMVAGTPHFVRCVKPNDAKEPWNFDPERVRTQLRYTGVLETTKIRRQGYSHRIPYSDFLKRYHVLGLYGTNKIPITRENCILLLEKLKMTGWAMGKTKVFLKYYHVEELARQFENLQRRVIQVQACVRSWMQRTRFYKMKWQQNKAAVTVQKWTRGWFARKQYKDLTLDRNKAATSIQRIYRGYKARRQYKPVIAHRKEAAGKVQRAYRKHRLRSSLKRRHEMRAVKANKEAQSAQFIQRMYRLYRVKKNTRNILYHEHRRGHAAIIIQTYYRMWKAKTFYRQLTDYRSMKESQLADFANEAERHSSQMNAKLRGLEEADVSATNALVELDATLAEETDRRAKPRLPAWERVNQEEVGESRIEQMRKMYEIKSTMPENAAEYYDSLNGNNNAPALLVNGETPSLHQLETKRGLVTNVNKRRDDDNSSELNYTKQEEESGLETAESRHLSRLLLAKSAARVFMANKPGQHDVTVTDTDMSDMDSLSLPWDAPLMSARKHSLSAEIDGSGYISRCSIYSIEADLMAEKDELFDEEDKHELALRLEQEVAGSILAMWRQRLTQPMMPMNDIEISYDSDDESMSTGRSTPTSTSPRSPPYIQTTVPIPVQFSGTGSMGKKSGTTTLPCITGTPHSQVGSTQSDSDGEDANNTLDAARRKLRKTTFDYSKDTLQRTNDVTPQQIDFRHVLKKHPASKTTIE